jgi:polysaccharide export outer membrane protein
MAAKPERDTFLNRCAIVVGLLGLFLPPGGLAQSKPPESAPPPFKAETTQDYNKRLQELQSYVSAGSSVPVAGEYRIGPEDLLEISIFEAPEMNRAVRVSANGEISMPLLGAVRAAGLTPRELEFVLQELLRRTYMKDPHVSVFVKEMESHPISVVGAVKKPGVFQVRGAKSLLEVLSLAEGLDDDAGDTVIVMRGAGLQGEAAGNQATGQPQEGAAQGSPASEEAAGPNAVRVDLKELLESGDPAHNVPVYPGDIVKVTRAGIVYVVGEVKKPGGFVLRTNENISVLQALALGEGLTRTAAKNRARIIRTNEKTGERTEVAVDLGKIMAGKSSDLSLRAKDILFVPNSNARSVLYRGADAAVSIVSGVIVFRR